MDQLFEGHDLSYYIPVGEIYNLNMPMSINKFESTTNNFLKQKTTGPDSFTVKFYQTFKEKKKPVLYNLFQNILIFYEARINYLI